jgi:hypothetical protein
MPKPSQEQELMKLRALLRRLQAREAALTLAVEDKPHPFLRPGWPIRRITQARLH